MLKKICLFVLFAFGMNCLNACPDLGGNFLCKHEGQDFISLLSIKISRTNISSSPEFDFQHILNNGSVQRDLLFADGKYYTKPDMKSDGNIQHLRSVACDDNVLRETYVIVYSSQIRFREIIEYKKTLTGVEIIKNDKVTYICNELE